MIIQIIGAGIMGRGIAQVCITSGFETHLVDIDEKILKEAGNEIKKRLTREVEKERLTENQKEKALVKLNFSQSWQENIDNTDVLIECVPENPELKKKIIQEVHNTSNCIVASNTSSISIDELAKVSKKPSRVIGMHFFNPPPVMKLVEIIIGKETSKNTIGTITKLALEMKKEPIHVQDFPGFASSRLGVVLGMEAIRMVEQGVASPEDIDKAMTLGYRHPMGPLELTDYIGLDTRLKIADYLNDSGVSPAFEVPSLLRELVNEGKLGRKSGQGFYTWKDGKRV